MCGQAVRLEPLSWDGGSRVVLLALYLPATATLVPGQPLGVYVGILAAAPLLVGAIADRSWAPLVLVAVGAGIAVYGLILGDRPAGNDAGDMSQAEDSSSSMSSAPDLQRS